MSMRHKAPLKRNAKLRVSGACCVAKWEILPLVSHDA